jgi:hypothetical protein
LPRDRLGFTVNLLTVAAEDQIKCRTEKHWSEPKKPREKVSRLQLKLEPHFGSDFGHKDESKNPKSGPRN